MRQVGLGPLPPCASTEQTLDWLIRAVREYENASTEDPIAVAESLTAGTPRSTCATSKWRAGGFARPAVRCDRNML